MIERKFDRLVQFDPRSRNFPIRTAAETPLPPRSYTWAVPTVLDQGSDGACVGFAWTHELLARPVKVPGLTAEFALKDLYWAAQRMDEWPGGAYPGADPFYEGTSVLAGAKACRDLGYFTEYRWAFGLADLRYALGYKGPAVLGINWYDGMFFLDERGYIRPTGAVAGGHAVLAYANSERNKRISIWNSWGPGWGRGGSAFISYDDMDRLLHEQGEACIPVSRHQRKV